MTVASRSYFDSRFWLPLLIRSSTRTTSAFDSSSGKISGFGLQSALRAATPSLALDARPGFDSELTLASGFDASFGGCYQHRLVGAASAARAGAARRERTGNIALLSMNPLIPWYTVATVMLIFVSNGRCSWALDWIITSLLSVRTVILLFYYIILNHYYLIITY